MVVYFSKEYHNETKIQNPKDYGGMVKWLSQQTFNLPVPGSNPSAPTICKHIIADFASMSRILTSALEIGYSVFLYGSKTAHVALQCDMTGCIVCWHAQ